MKNFPPFFLNDSVFGSIGDFDKAKGSLVLTILVGKVINAFTKVIFTFSLKNMPTNHQATTVVLSAGQISNFGQNSKAFASSVMTNPEGYLFGVQNGYRPLETVLPGFLFGTVEQSTPVAAAVNNIITVSFATNILCANGSILTLTGLNRIGNRSKTAFLDIYGHNSSVFLYGRGEFDAALPGILKLTVAKPILGGSIVSFNFIISNQEMDSDAQIMMLSGTSFSPFTNGMNLFAAFEMNTPTVCTEFIFGGISACTRGTINRIGYDNNENMSWTIAPQGASSVTLTFTEFSTVF